MIYLPYWSRWRHLALQCHCESQQHNDNIATNDTQISHTHQSFVVGMLAATLLFFVIAFNRLIFFINNKALLETFAALLVPTTNVSSELINSSAKNSNLMSYYQYDISKCHLNITRSKKKILWQKKSICKQTLSHVLNQTEALDHFLSRR